MTVQFDYAATALKADKLLAKFGRAATLRHVQIGAYNPATSRAAQSTSDSTVNAAIFPYAAGISQRSNGLIQETDQQCFLSTVNSGAQPEPGDKLIWGSDTYQIIDAHPISPAGTPVLFDVQVRK